MRSQKNAVYEAIMSVLTNHEITYEFNKSPKVETLLTDPMIKEIRAIVFDGFKKGTIAFTEESKVKYSTDDKLKSYVSGLVNNWIRKGKEFNGGQGYVPENKGSRAGSGDETIRELKKLAKQADLTEGDRAEVQAAIDARLAEIKPKVEINPAALPESLRHLVK